MNGKWLSGAVLLTATQLAMQVAMAQDGEAGLQKRSFQQAAAQAQELGRPLAVFGLTDT